VDRNTKLKEAAERATRRARAWIETLIAAGLGPALSGSRLTGTWTIARYDAVRQQHRPITPPFVMARTTE